MDQLVALMVNHGALVVFAATLAARIGAPVPASPLLVIAGGLVAGGELSGAAVLLASIIANIAGDSVWFQAGRRYGYRVMKLLCKVSLSPDSCVQQSESALSRWGGSSLVAAKFLPGVSTVAAPMAGALRMSWSRFLAFDLAAAVLWSLAFLVPGMLFSEQIVEILDAMAQAGAAALVALVILLSAFLAFRYLRRRALLRDVAMRRISVNDLHELIREGAEPIIIDVRSHASVRADPRQVPGAITVPLNEVASRATSLPRDREIVLYCNCPNEVSAALAARRLMAQGIERARPLYGGLDAWFAGDDEPLSDAASGATLPGSAPAALPEDPADAPRGPTAPRPGPAARIESWSSRTRP